MKVKYFLRGLGTGIILTALVLCISYRSENKDSSVVEQAKELGMVFPAGTKEPPDMTAMPEKTAPVPSQKSASGVGITGEEPVREPSAKPVNSPKVRPTEKSTVTATPKPTVAATQKPAVTASPVALKGKKFTVRGGLLSSSVAREMKQAGIIKDADAFDEYLEKNGYGRQVRAGTYQIPKGASFKEIAQIITRQD